MSPKPTPLPTAHCEPGEEKISNGDCTKCDAGKYKTGDGPGPCEDCPLGKIQASTGKYSCDSCKHGLYPNPARTVCTYCQPGQFVQSINSTNSTGNTSNATGRCVDCTVGTYAPAAQDGSCLVCPKGSSTLGVTVAATTCYPCPPGNYSSQDNSVRCNKCQPGAYTQSPGSTRCSKCDAGKYAKHAGSTYCSSCADGTQDGFGDKFWSYPGAIGCSTCREGCYRDDHWNLARNTYKPRDRETAPCFSCPDHTDCTENNQGLGNLPIKRYFFRFTSTSHKIYKCPYHDACLGSNARSNLDSNITADNKTMTNQTAGNALCADGYHGPLCAVCSQGYGFTQGTSKCEKCDKKLYWQTTGVAATIVVSVGLLGVTIWCGCRRRINNFSRWSKNNQTFVNLMSSQLTTIIVTVQTGILINANHEAAGGSAPPQTYQKVIGLFDVLSLKIDLVPMGCFDPAFGYFGVLIMQTLGVIGIAMVLMFLWRNIRIRVGCGGMNDDGHAKIDDHSKADDEPGLIDEPREEIPRPRAYVCRAFKRKCFWVSLQDMQTRRHMYARYGVTFIKLVLPVVSLKIAQAFQCKTYDYGYNKSKTWLTGDYTVDCHKTKHTIIKIYAIIMTCILPVGMPILALVELYRLRYHKRVEKTAHRDESYEVLDGKEKAEPSYRALEGEEKSEEPTSEQRLEESPFTILWRDVKPEFWYMEVVDIVRRLLLTCIPFAFTNFANVIVFSLAVVLLALVIQYDFRPYKMDAMNTVKIMEAWQNLLCIVVLLIQDAHMFESDTMYDLAGVVLLVVDAMMIAVMAWSAWKRGASRPGNLEDDIIDTGNDYVPPRITDETVTKLQEQHTAEMERLREQLRNQAERHAAKSEQFRVESERTKAESEQIRAESERIRAESERTKAESERIKAESERVKAESERRIEQIKAEVTELRRRLEDFQ